MSLPEARNEILGRFTREAKPRLVQASRFADAKPMRLVPPPGTLVVYWTRPEVDLLDGLADALRAGDGRAVSALERGARGLVRLDEQPVEERYLDALRSAECVFDVQYRGKPLAENLALLYGNELGTATLSFLGGKILTADVRIIEYHLGQPTRRPRQKYLIAYQAPRLTELERAAIERLGRAEEGAVISPGAWPQENNQKPMTEVADVVACMVHETKKGFDPLIFEHLERRLESGELNPHAGVQELMRLRGEIVLRAMQRSR